MMKTLLSILFCGVMFIAGCSAAPDEEFSLEGGIAGLWKCRDQNSDKPRSLVAIYKYQDMYYGRMLGTYDPDGKFNDTILEKKDRAPGIAGNPPYCGMDFVYDLKKAQNSDKYKGRIIDPQKGNIYRVEMWLEGDNILILRGKVWIFGKNIPWQKASKSDLPKGFSMADIKKFKPEVPQPK